LSPLPNKSPSPSLTRLIRVTRDGNPRRRYGHVSPHIGKLKPLDDRALDRISQLALASLPAFRGTTLVLGLAESSLVLAAWVACRLERPADLCFTTRDTDRSQGARTFQEPHSHGPCHYLPLPVDRRYDQVLIVEDEVTTGRTLKNLALELRDLSRRMHIVALTDLRTDEQRTSFATDLAAAGIELEFIDLSRCAASPLNGCAPRGPLPTPFCATETQRHEATCALETTCRRLRPGTMYMVGECVDGPLAVWDALPPDLRPALQQVSRSPWLVDEQGIRSRLELGLDSTGTPYFLYNWSPPRNARALVVAAPSSMEVAERLCRHLESQAVRAESFEFRCA